MNVFRDLLLDPRLRRGAFPITIAMLAAVNVAIWLHHGRLEAARRENLLITAPTQSVRYDPSVGEHLDVYFSRIPDATAAPLVVIAGMSQMYAINERKPGDQIIAEWLDDALAPKGVRVFGLAAPNLSNEEAVLYLLATAASSETHPTAFIYAICFDKLRNVDLRPTLKNFLASRPAVKEAWKNACGDGLADKYPMACEKMKATLATLDTPAEKPQASASDAFEQHARASAARAFPLVADRQNLNATLMTDIFLLRNKVLNIKATTKRPIIQSRYDLNLQFIQLLTELAQRANVNLFFYVIPLNPLSDNPYIPEQYAGFKVWIENLAHARSIPFANLEGAVPADDWGFNEQGPDFKHFKGTGHRITADAILKAFGPALRDFARGQAARETSAP
jgi:hypothetical protein